MPLMFLLVSLLFAPPQRPSDVVKWSAEAPVAAVRAGGTVDVKVSARVQPGWKLYAIQQPEGGPKPLLFATAAGSPFEVVTSRIVAPKAKVQAQDVNFSADTRYYENEAGFTIPVTVARTAPAGAAEVPLEVTFQACGAELCLRPFTQKVPVTITIAK